MNIETKRRLVPYFITLYMVFLLTLTIVLLPVVPVLMLISYIRDGTLDLPPLEDKL